MNRPSYLLLGLLVLSVLVSAFVLSSPDMAERYAEMRRSVTLGRETQDLLLALLALALGGYVGWQYLKRD